MSFYEHENYFIFYCDTEGCDHFAAFKPHHFFDCVDELKARGWGFIPPSRGEFGDDWSHQCPKHRKRLADLLNEKFPKAVKG